MSDESANDQSAGIPYGGPITPELFVRAQRFALGKSLAVVWLFPLSMTGWSWYQDGFEPVILAASLVLGCIFPLLALWWLRWHWRRLYSQSPYLVEPVNAAITDEGVEFRGSTVAGMTPWARFMKAKGDDDLVLLYHAPNIFTIVPRDFFRSAEAWREAKATIRRKVPGAKIK